MVTLALLSAGERPDSPTIKGALEYLRRFGPGDLRSTYAISLQTMVFASAGPGEGRVADPGRMSNGWKRPRSSPATLSSGRARGVYSELKQGRPGDNSNTHYALLGLDAASEIGIPVKQTVWELAPGYWERHPETRRKLGLHARRQEPDRQHDLHGVSSLIISGLERVPGGESFKVSRSRSAARAGLTGT